jgi:small subunit ribosomal protein S13
MARISGIDLPKNKRGEIGLTYIYGIGRVSAQSILNKAGVDLTNAFLNGTTRNWLKYVR